MLKAYLGASVEVSTTEHFSIVHEAQASFVPGTGRMLEQAYTRFYQAFCQAGFKPAQPANRLVWICFPRQNGFNEYAVQAEGMDLSWLDGYYSTLTNRVSVVQPSPTQRESDPVDNPSGMRLTLAANAEPVGEILPLAGSESRLDVARLTHELAHQLAFNSGIQKRGVMYPFWVSEGLATNFEFDFPVGAGFDGCNATRRDCLVKAYAAGELVSLRQFVVQTKVPADNYQSRRHYAQAWAFFQFLITERREQLQDYLRQVATLPPSSRSTKTMLREFSEAFGSPESIEGAWTAFLDRQVDAATATANAAPLTPQP